MFRGDRVGFTLGCLKTFIADAGGVAGLAQLSPIPIPTLTIAVEAGLIGVRQCFMDYKSKVSATRKNGGFAYIVSAYRNGLIRRTGFNEII